MMHANSSPYTSTRPTKLVPGQNITCLRRDLPFTIYYVTPILRRRADSPTTNSIGSTLWAITTYFALTWIYIIEQILCYSEHFFEFVFGNRWNVYIVSTWKCTSSSRIMWRYLLDQVNDEIDDICDHHPLLRLQELAFSLGCWPLSEKKKKSFLAGSSSVLYFNDSLNKLMARFSSTIVVELIEGRWSLQALVQHTSQALNVHVIGPLHELKDVSLGRESPPKPNYCRHFSERGLTVFVGI